MSRRPDPEASRSGRPQRHDRALRRRARAAKKRRGARRVPGEARRGRRRARCGVLGSGVAFDREVGEARRPPDRLSRRALRRSCARVVMPSLAVRVKHRSSSLVDCLPAVPSVKLSISGASGAHQLHHLAVCQDSGATVRTASLRVALPGEHRGNHFGRRPREPRQEARGDPCGDREALR